ncbi:Taurine-binding periplasmic protein precursor [Pelotomaculum sp. FP]|uniref:ABC transporter substrate-binding subunit SaoX n=1 Tax=Pelotomaculum sp. FP TaxID=261474 RepID=UPI001065E0B2|nr:ABC transporter substrate-binding subunit SaoX [Pelotomaculum sp. FP]TEB14195.1 Taurine-binding periplasmic protein precursor [Pelotomaculum sp. FP]
MNNKIRTVMLLIVSISLLTLLTGCGGGDKPADQNKAAANIAIPEKDKDYVVQLGYYDCDHMTGACIAKDAGIYDKLGLKVNVLGNAKVPEAMAAGQMDVGYVGNSRMMRAFLQGSPIVVGANNHIGGSHYLVASNDIKEPKDLLGKKLAIGTAPEKNNPSWIVMAERLGLPIEGANYEVLNMADKDEYFALKAGKLDGYAACDPWGSMAEFEKTGHVLAAMDKLPSGEWGECCAFNLNKNFATEHPELAKLMVLSHTKAIEHMYLKPVRSAEIFAENYKVPMEVALMTMWKKTVAEGRTITWKIDLNNWQRQIDMELGFGTLDKAPNVNEFIQPQYLNESGADDFDTFIKEKVDPVFPVGMSYEEWKTKAYKLEGKTA